MQRYRLFLLILPFIVFLSCEDDADCPDCGKLTEGYLFKKVTQDDFAAFAGVRYRGRCLYAVQAYQW